MLNIKEKGQPIARIISGTFKNEVIYLDRSDEFESPDFVKTVELKKSKLEPIIDPEGKLRVYYIAGSSGSGKSTYMSSLAKSFKKLFPKKPIYIFSRMLVTDDPAFKGMKLLQVKLDCTLISDPIDIAEIEMGSLMLFDDFTTVQDKDIKDAINKLIEDILETGRKKKLYIILANHLVNPNEKKLGRTIMNELQAMTVFPRSGSSYQITRALKVYFGLNSKQIDKIMKLKSRWVTIIRQYPTTVLYEHGAYLI